MRSFSRRQMSFLGGVVAGFLVVELVVRSISPLLGPPLDHYATVAHAKAVLIDRRDSAATRFGVVFAGNSSVVEGIRMDMIERSCPSCGEAYNAALNGATTYIVRRFLLEEIVGHAHPKAVVVGLSSGEISDVSDAQNVAYDAAPATSPRSSGWLRSIASHLFVYRYRNTLRDPLTVGTLVRSALHRSKHEGIIDRHLLGLSADGDKLALTYDAQPAQPLTAAPVTSATLRVALPTAGVRELDILHRALDKDGIKLVLVVMPSAEMDAGFAAAVEDVGQRMNVRVIDARSAVASLAQFYDGVHVNASGAADLSAYVGRSLEALHL